eukprot:TRINITY_DN14441_c0_g1_i3.p1 TRINITY_DN14441_c0_g1~~TRINITY_DN14441_c0_g1_i3.p1  ORF type:complete len:797 (-),score=149.12 TRINITY_DN14441_c0_g1_i3:502-2781(-)
MRALPQLLLLLLPSLGYAFLSAISESTLSWTELEQPTLVAVQREFSGRAANLTAQWNGLGETSEEHWVSLWSPPDFPLPVKLVPISKLAASGQVGGGAGTVTFEVINVRHPYVFRLTVGQPGSKGASTIAESEQIHPAPIALQIHTAATSVPGEVKIIWTDTVGNAAPPMVKYGKELNDLRQTAHGQTTTYTKKDLEACGTTDKTAIEKWFDTGFIHTVLLQNLELNSPFFYSVGHQDLQVWSEAILHNGALPGSANEETKMLYLGDMGIGPGRDDEFQGALNPTGDTIGRENSGPLAGGRLVLESVLKNEGEALRDVDLVFVNGDITYACGHNWINEAWFAMMEPLIARIPLMVSLGNHEWDHETSGWPPRDLFPEDEYGEDSGGECGIVYRRRFQMPEGTSSSVASAAAMPPDTFPAQEQQGVAQQQQHAEQQQMPEQQQTQQEQSGHDCKPHGQDELPTQQQQLQQEWQAQELIGAEHSPPREAAEKQSDKSAKDGTPDSKWGEPAALALSLMQLQLEPEAAAAVPSSVSEPLPQIPQAVVSASANAGDDAMPDTTTSLSGTGAAPEAAPTDFAAWYSFDSGHVHMTVISTEHDFGAGSKQHRWLDAELAAVDRSKTPWLIVAQHREIFNGSTAQGGVQGYMHEHLEPLYLKHGVDVVLAAHVHTYSRTCPLKQGKCVLPDEAAPVYILDGLAGSYTLDEQSKMGRECQQPTGFQKPVLAQDCTWGWGRITAQRQWLKWEHVRWNDSKVGNCAPRK